MPQNISRRSLLKGICGGIITGGLSVLPWSGCRTRVRDGRVNIILITLDTTRADSLGCYGYERDTSPFLDTFANESVLYSRALATSSWTLPAHASLFTGKFTSSHGARYDPEGPFSLASALDPNSDNYKKHRARTISSQENTLAQILKDADYLTGAVVSGPWLKKVFRLNKGFDYYADDQINALNGKAAAEVTSQALRWLKRIGRDPFFLFLNYFDPHYPYSAPGDFCHAFLPADGRPIATITSPEEMRALYDGEIRYMDYHIGQLFKNLKSLGLYDNSMIMVTADHGELFGEHGLLGHGNTLYQEELHIPLIVKYPGTELSAGQEDSPIQLIDILPMILNRLNMPLPQGIQGTVPPQITHPVFAEVYPLPFRDQYQGDWRALYEGTFKFLWNSKGEGLLFNLEEDPREAVNLIDRHGKRAQSMEDNMEKLLASLPKPGPAGPPQKIDEHTRDALKGLGYL